jgi:hypothetical protein
MAIWIARSANWLVGDWLVWVAKTLTSAFSLHCWRRHRNQCCIQTNRFRIRLPLYLINQTPREKFRHGVTLRLLSQPNHYTLVLQSPGLITLYTPRGISPRESKSLCPLCIQTQSFLLGDNSSIITLYLNPFITPSYY